MKKIRCEKEKRHDASVDYAKVLIKLLDDRGIPMKYVENDLGISRGYLKRCAGGTHHLSVDVIRDLEEYIGIPDISRYMG